MRIKWHFIAIALLLISLVLASAIPVLAKDVVIVRPNPALDDLTDVDASSPGNGAFLVWNGTAAMWVDYILVLSLDDLDDVNAGSPTDGQVITWNDVAGEWETTDVVATVSAIWDADTDTGIQTEESADEDILRFDTAGSEVMVIDDAGKVGIGTSTIPHGGVGYAKFAIEGPAASAAGPHIQYTVDSDDYPVFQQIHWGHDNSGLSFDAYYDGAWRSSDVGSNFQIYKIGDLLQFRYDSGIAAGDAVTWNNGLVMDTSGYVGIGTDSPASDLHLYGRAPVLTVTTTSEVSGFRINVAAPQTGTNLFRLQYAGATKLTVGVDGDILLVAGGDISFANDNTRIHESAGDLYLEADDDIYISPDDDVRIDGITLFVDGAYNRVGIGHASPLEPLFVKTDSGGEAIGIQEWSGTEGWELGVDSDGDLNFQNTGSVRFHFDDYNNMEIYDGALCVDNGLGSCGGTVDGYIYCHDVIEYTHYWDENVSGSALEEIMRHEGILPPGGKMAPDYDTFMEGVKVTGYDFPKYLLERFESSDITPYEFYNTLTSEEKNDVIPGCSGISMGGRISQNEQGIRELYLIIQEQQTTIAQQQEDILALQNDVAKIKELLGIK